MARKKATRSIPERPKTCKRYSTQAEIHLKRLIAAKKREKACRASSKKNCRNLVADTQQSKRSFEEKLKVVKHWCGQEIVNNFSARAQRRLSK